MTQEDKELLLKDLCSRIPYNVQVVVNENIEFINTLDGIDINGYCEVNEEVYNINNIKPYLFPLSTISDKIIDEIYNNTGIYDICIDSSIHIEIGTKFEDLSKIFDILHKYHIDYRNLIKKGLAINATGSTIYEK